MGVDDATPRFRGAGGAGSEVNGLAQTIFVRTSGRYQAGLGVTYPKKPYRFMARFAD
jgi:hypothetical protein